MRISPKIILSAILGIVLFLCSQYAFAIDPDEAIDMLKAGNERFVSENARFTCSDGDCVAIGREYRESNNCNLTTPDQLACLKDGQHPFATIVSCSDSRIVPEIIFDVGMEDIFVIRVAGNTWDDVALGSIEYGVEHAHTPILVILGHQHCGAVTATVNAVIEKEKPTGFIHFIVDRILHPVLQTIKELGSETSKEELIAEATKKNVEYVKQTVIKKSKVVQELIEEGELGVVGAIAYMEGVESTDPAKRIEPGEVVFENDSRW
jgi:carbonic anhydrase